MTLVGIIIYIGAITEEASSKSKEKDDHSAFVFYYGPSLVLAIASFVGCQLTGVVSINHFIALRHRAARKRKNHDVYCAGKGAARTGNAAVGMKVCRESSAYCEPRIENPDPRPYSLLPLGANQSVDVESNTSNIPPLQSQHDAQQLQQTDVTRKAGGFSPYGKFSWIANCGGIRSETLYTVNGEASSVYRCPQTMATSSSPEADTSEEHREEQAIKGLSLLGVQHPPELLLSCYSLFPGRPPNRTTPIPFTKRHQRPTTKQEDKSQQAFLSAKKNSHRKQKRKRTKHELDQRSTLQRILMGATDNFQPEPRDNKNAEKGALRKDLLTSSSGDWCDFSSAENLLVRSNKRTTLV